MSQLQTLDGRPLSWEALHEAGARYWSTRQRDGSLTPTPPVYSSQCAHETHSRCSGRRQRDGRACTCACHGANHD